uniref:MULE transposase domain-containing protein n=1 Tax=Meloidogyne javanica TaxID=6303 RepID=A0A915MAD5_MELJA
MLQLYTINVLIEQSSVGAAYVLMANKAQATYIRVLNALNERIQQPPLSVMLDFEI